MEYHPAQTDPATPPNPTVNAPDTSSISYHNDSSNASNTVASHQQRIPCENLRPYSTEFDMYHISWLIVRCILLFGLIYGTMHVCVSSLEVNGYYIIRPPIPSYNETAALATHNHSNLTRDLAACDITGTPHSRCLEYKSYSAIGLADILAARLEPPSKTFLGRKQPAEKLIPFQKEGLQLLSTCNFSIHPQTQDFPLQCPFDAFNIVFFDGVIDSSAVSLQWIDPLLSPEYVAQVVRLQSNISDLNHLARLEMVRSTHTKRPLLRASRAQYYAEILLHKMTHVVFELYACDICERKSKLSTTGLLGHGPAFQTLARAIESAAGPLLQNSSHRKWDLGIKHSTVYDARANELAAGWEKLVSKADSLNQGRSVLDQLVEGYREGPTASQ